MILSLWLTGTVNKNIRTNENNFYCCSGALIVRRMASVWHVVPKQLAQLCSIFLFEYLLLLHFPRLPSISLHHNFYLQPNTSKSKFNSRVPSFHETT